MATDLFKNVPKRRTIIDVINDSKGFSSRHPELARGNQDAARRRGSSSGGGRSQSNAAVAELARQDAARKAAAEVARLNAEKEKARIAANALQIQENIQRRNGQIARAMRLKELKNNLIQKGKDINASINRTLEKTSQNLQSAKDRVRANKASGKTNRIVGEAAGFQFAVAQSVVSTARAIKAIPGLVGNVYELRQKPKRDKFIRSVKDFANKEFKKVQRLKDPKVRSFVKVELGKKVRSAEQFAKNNPGEIVGFVAGEVLLVITGGKAVKAGGKVVNKVLDINTVKVVTQGGKKVVQVKKQGGLLTGKATRGNRKAGSVLEFEVGGVKEGAESLSKAASRAGTKARAVSAQADEILRFEKSFVNRLRKRTVVRKPLPLDVEAGLSKRTLELLQKFDKNKLNFKQVIQLNKQIRKESLKIKGVKGVQPKGIDLLERSTYFDPERLLRSSRLAVDSAKEGRFRDLLRPILKNKRTRGNLRGGRDAFEAKAKLFAGRTAKPNILFVEEMIEVFPKTKAMQKIKRKLKANKPLNKDELARLTNFQVTPSGQLKPIGSTTFAGGIEREVTAAAGDIIKFKKKIATLSYKGKRIPIYEVKIVKGKVPKVKLSKVEKSLAALKKKLRLSKSKTQKKVLRSKISKVEKRVVAKKQKKVIKTLKKDIKKSRKRSRKVKKITNRRKRTSKRGKRVVPKRKKAAIAGRVLRKGAKRSKRAKRSPTKRSGGRPVGTGRPRPTGRTTPRPRPTARGSPSKRITPTKRPTPKAPAKPGVPKKPGKILLRPKFRKIKKKKGKKSPTGYHVFARPLKVRKGKKRRLLKVNIVPINKRDAKNLRNYVVDTSLSRTGQIKSTRKRIKTSGVKAPSGYAAKTRNKFRSHRIVKKRKVSLKRGRVIEKNKASLDTRQEKRKISLKRRIAQLRKKKKKMVKKKTARRSKK